MTDELRTTIKKLRKNKKLTQQNLSDKLNVARQTIFYWESGRQEPNPKQRKNLCNVLGITVSELFGGKPLNESEKSNQFKTIPITGVAKASGKISQPKKELKSDTSKSFYTHNKSHKAILIKGNTLFSYKEGDVIIYCEKTPVEDNNMVYIKLKNTNASFKKIRNITVDRYENITPEAKNNLKSLGETFPNEKFYILYNTNPTVDTSPIFTNSSEIEFCYKIVGSIYK